MKAVVYRALGELPAVAEVPEPACPADGVVVEVAATGVCRSDWHAWRGHDPVTLPHVPGHEYAGTVAAVGPQVTRVAVGDRVTVPFVLGCGACEHCRAGDAQVCPDQLQPGFTLPGSFAERVAVPRADANVVLLPDVSPSWRRPPSAAGSPPRSAPWWPTARSVRTSGSPCTAPAGSACRR